MSSRVGASGGKFTQPTGAGVASPSARRRALHSKCWKGRREKRGKSATVALSGRSFVVRVLNGARRAGGGVHDGGETAAYCGPQMPSIIIGHVVL